MELSFARVARVIESVSLDDLFINRSEIYIKDSSNITASK